MNVVTFDTLFGTWIKTHQWGVYDAVATTPVSPGEVVLGNFVWESTRAVLYGGVFMLVMALLGLFHSPWGLLLPLVLAAMGPLFSGPAMAWAILCKRSFHHLFYYTELVVSPMFFFSGAFFPVDRLPSYLQVAIWITPLYHVVTLERALTYGTLTWSLLVDVAYIAALTLALAPVAVRLLNRQLTS